MGSNPIARSNFLASGKKIALSERALARESKGYLNEAQLYQTALDTYRAFEVELLGGAHLHSELLRLQPDPVYGGVDNISPTEVRDDR